MAFPGTLNISYYKGDTYEFRIYPKDSLGASFDLSQYRDARFTISTSRGTSGLANQVECSAVITSGLGNYVTCTIRPDDLIGLNASVQYVYDVQIKRISSPHNYVHTLLTGTVSITDDISVSAGSSQDLGNVKYKVVYVDKYNTTGSIPSNNNLYITGQTAPVISGTIARPGYTLSGWTTNESTTLPLYTVGQTITFGNSDIVLYSVWGANTYTITYKAGTGGSGSDLTQTFVYGNTATLKDATAALTKSGYAISGWSTTDGGSKTHELSSSYSSASDLILYPVWTAN